MMYLLRPLRVCSMFAPNVDAALAAGIPIEDAGIAIDAAGSAALDDAARACALRCSANALVAARRLGWRPRDFDCLTLALAALNEADDDGPAAWLSLLRAASAGAS